MTPIERDLLRGATSSKLEILQLSDLFMRAGHHLYLVGGPVRDALLGRHIDDWDLCTDATPDEIERIVNGWADSVWDVGREYGTIAMQKHRTKIEVTTFRTEKYASGDRHPTVQFTTSLAADLSRRDFTINAMALDLRTLKLYDPFGGHDDIKRRLLRTPLKPEDTFIDDPLRMMRAARFISKLNGFKLETYTQIAMEDLHRLIRNVSVERVKSEVFKMMESPRPADGVFILQRAGIWDEITRNVHYLSRLVETAIHTTDVHCRIASMFTSSNCARATLIQWKCSNEEVKHIGHLVEVANVWMDESFKDQPGIDWIVRTFCDQAGPDRLAILTLMTADYLTQGRRGKPIARLTDRIHNLEERGEDLYNIRPKLNGGDVMDILGIGPGPEVGRALMTIKFKMLDDGPFSPEEEREIVLQSAES